MKIFSSVGKKNISDVYCDYGMKTKLININLKVKGDAHGLLDVVFH